jgi:hypothetical protein
VSADTTEIPIAPVSARLRRKAAVFFIDTLLQSFHFCQAAACLYFYPNTEGGKQKFIVFIITIPL